MPNTITAQPAASSPQAASNALCCTPVNQSEFYGNFSDILHAILGGLEKGLSNLGNGRVMTTDGKLISIDELMQKPAAKEDNSSGDTVTVIAMLQQILAQIQTTGIVPPAVNIKSGAQSGAYISPGAQSDKGADTALAAVPAPTDNGAKATGLNSAGNSFMQAGASAKTDAYPLTAGDPPAAETSLNAAGPAPREAGIPLADVTSSAAAGKPSVAKDLSEFASAAASGGKDVPLPVPNNPLPDKNVRPLSTSNSKNDNNNNDTSRGAQSALPDLQGNATDQVKSLSQFKSALDKGEIGISVQHDDNDIKIIVAPEKRSSGENADGAADRAGNVSAVAPHQMEYSKGESQVKNTVHISRLNEISEPIMKALGSGTQHITIKIEPPDLGSIQIRLKMDNGVLKADFRVDSSSVKDAFSLAVPQIKAALENAGIRAGDFFVDVKDSYYSDGREQREDTQQQQRQQHQHQQQNKGSEFSLFDLFA